MTGFKLTDLAKGACLYSGRLELFSFTITDPATGQAECFKDVPFVTGSSARDILEWLNRCYGPEADSHLDPELEHYLPLIVSSTVGEAKSPFDYDRTLRPFDDIRLTCDTPPRIKEPQTGRVVSLHEIPDMQIAADVMRARLRFLAAHAKGEGDRADYKIVDQSLRRDEVILLCLTDVYPQHRSPPSSLFKSFDLMMLVPYASDLVRQAKRVALVLSYGDNLDSTDACLWIKDNDPGIPSKATTISAISRREDYTQPFRMMTERLSHRGSKDFQPIWEAAKLGHLIVFCLRDLHTKFRDDPKLGHVSNITPFHLKPKARELLAVAKRALFVNSLTGGHDECQCIYWKGEPEAGPDPVLRTRRDAPWPEPHSGTVAALGTIPGYEEAIDLLEKRIYDREAGKPIWAQTIKEAADQEKVILLYLLDLTPYAPLPKDLGGKAVTLETVSLGDFKKEIVKLIRESWKVVLVWEYQVGKFSKETPCVWFKNAPKS